MSSLLRDLYLAKRVHCKDESQLELAQFTISEIAIRGQAFNISNTYAFWLDHVMKAADGDGRVLRELRAARPPFDLVAFEIIFPHSQDKKSAPCIAVLSHPKGTPDGIYYLVTFHKMIGGWELAPTEAVCVITPTGKVEAIISTTLNDQNWPERLRRGELQRPERGSWRELSEMIACHVLFSICLMNCRGARQVEYQVPPKVLKKRLSRGEPAFKTYVLDVEPTKLARRPGQSNGESGIEMSQHFCRGHFGDYREKGLFGKHKGLFWFGPHIRGNPNVGVIDKSYRLHPPEAAP